MLHILIHILLQSKWTKIMEMADLYSLIYLIYLFIKPWNSIIFFLSSTTETEILCIPSWTQPGFEPMIYSTFHVPEQWCPTGIRTSYLWTIQRHFLPDGTFHNLLMIIEDHNALTWYCSPLWSLFPSFSHVIFARGFASTSHTKLTNCPSSQFTGLGLTINSGANISGSWWLCGMTCVGWMAGAAPLLPTGSLSAKYTTWWNYRLFKLTIGIFMHYAEVKWYVKHTDDQRYHNTQIYPMIHSGALSWSKHYNILIPFWFTPLVVLGMPATLRVCVCVCVCVFPLKVNTLFFIELYDTTYNSIITLRVPCTVSTHDVSASPYSLYASQRYSPPSSGKTSPMMSLCMVPSRSIT